jgi:quinol-cytochrome oxidoreductase complex cytochrome b subunit
MRYLPSLAVAFTLCACSNTVASLHYTPHATAAVAAQQFSMRQTRTRLLLATPSHA